MSLDLSLRRFENVSGLSLMDHARAIGMGGLMTSMSPSSTSQFSVSPLFQTTMGAQSRDKFSPANSMMPLNFLPNPNGMQLPKMEPPSALKFEENYIRGLCLQVSCPFCNLREPAFPRIYNVLWKVILI